MQELLTGKPGLFHGELDLWSEYWNREPFGPYIDWERHADLCTVAWNSPGRQKPLKPSDFMPRISTPPKTPEELHMKWKAMVGFFPKIKAK